MPFHSRQQHKRLGFWEQPIIFVNGPFLFKNGPARQFIILNFGSEDAQPKYFIESAILIAFDSIAPKKCSVRRGWVLHDRITVDSAQYYAESTIIHNNRRCWLQD